MGPTRWRGLSWTLQHRATGTTHSTRANDKKKGGCQWTGETSPEVEPRSCPSVERGATQPSISRTSVAVKVGAARWIAKD